MCAEVGQRHELPRHLPTQIDKATGALDQGKRALLAASRPARIGAPASPLSWLAISLMVLVPSRSLEPACIAFRFRSIRTLR